MKFKFKNKKKVQKTEFVCKPLTDESLHIPSDEDGKIIFLFKENTPLWLIDELNKRFRCNKNRGSKNIVVPV